MFSAIDTHDFETKVNQAKKFLQGGDKLKVSVRFRKRAIAHPQIGEELLKRFQERARKSALLISLRKWKAAAWSCSFHRRHRSKQEEFTMAKIKTKTHSGAKKRFKMTASGKVKYQKTNKRHRLTQKDTKRKRIARTVGIADSTNAPALKKLMPYL